MSENQSVSKRGFQDIVTSILEISSWGIKSLLEWGNLEYSILFVRGLKTRSLTTTANP